MGKKKKRREDDDARSRLHTIRVVSRKRRLVECAPKAFIKYWWRGVFYLFIYFQQQQAVEVCVCAGTIKNGTRQ